MLKFTIPPAEFTVYPSGGGAFKEYFPHLVRVQMLASIGHFVPFEAPDAFVEAIRTVL